MPYLCGLWRFANAYIEDNKRGAGNGASFYEDTTDYERKSSDNSGDF